ncbi:hypothetical protein AVEN_33469-1 [Araneus ventricosus]|uniref:Uncharacterized protein n=1 Tax=Araneus ventricosus TaxID=182803 RepID=A0A4Y2WRK3_ARAVE|nr:hypothetical protein AVEN_33469-1 [Araneus ventricosus]
MSTWVFSCRTRTPLPSGTPGPSPRKKPQVLLWAGTPSKYFSTAGKNPGIFRSNTAILSSVLKHPSFFAKSSLSLPKLPVLKNTSLEAQKTKILPMYVLSLAINIAILKTDDRHIPENRRNRVKTRKHDNSQFKRSGKRERNPAFFGGNSKFRWPISQGIR